MADVKITGVDAVVKELSGARDRVRNLTPVMRVAVEDIKAFVSDRFAGEVDPEGNDWQELSQEFADARRAGKGSGPDIKILTDTARLRNSVSGTAAVDGLEFGASADYAGQHQFGKGVPKRAFLPIDDDLQPLEVGPSGRLWAEIRAMVERFIHTGRVV